MKVKDLVLGKRYAFLLVTPAWRRSPKTSPLLHGECVDITGNSAILEHAEMVLSPQGLAKRAANPDALVGNASYVMGKKLYRVPIHRIVCLSDEWAPSAPDGRIDAPDVHRAAGHTFTSERLAVTG